MPAAPCSTTCVKFYNLSHKKQGDDALQHTAEQLGSLQTNRWRGGGRGGEGSGEGNNCMRTEKTDASCTAWTKSHAPAAPYEMGHRASYRPFVLQNRRRQTAVLLNLRALGPNMVADVLQSGADSARVGRILICDLN
jgi:hypothetical protein